MRELVRAEAEESERSRTLTKAIVDQMWATGLMTAFNPVEAGGVEPSFAEMIETWIEMAWQDGSFGWVGIANLPSSFAAAAYLPDEGFAEVFTSHQNRVTMGGQFFPNGQGVPCAVASTLSGSWSFGSGTGHSEYVAAGFFPMDDGEMRWISEGVPDMRVAVLPRDEITLHRRLACAGAQGHRLLRLQRRRRFRARAPDVRAVLPRAAAGYLAGDPDGDDARHRCRARVVGARVSPRACSTTSQELAATKFRMSDMASLASRPTFQKGLAHHVAAWRAARLLVLDAFTTAEAAVAAGEELTPALRADMRVAAVYATDVARRVRRVGTPGRGYQLDPGRQPPRAGVPRHLHRHPARVHQREGGDRRGTDLARHHRGPVRPLIFERLRG